MGVVGVAVEALGKVRLLPVRLLLVHCPLPEKLSFLQYDRCIHSLTPGDCAYTWHDVDPYSHGEDTLRIGVDCSRQQDFGVLSEKLVITCPINKVFTYRKSIKNKLPGTKLPPRVVDDAQFSFFVVPCTSSIDEFVPPLSKNLLVKFFRLSCPFGMLRPGSELGECLVTRDNIGPYKQ